MELTAILHKSRIEFKRHFSSKTYVLNLIVNKLNTARETHPEEILNMEVFHACEVNGTGL